MKTPDMIVIGATGEIGRWAVAELTAAGHALIALVRNSDDRATAFRTWVNAHGGDADRITILEGDLTDEAFVFSLATNPATHHVRWIYNLSGKYAWGLTRAEASSVNVAGALQVMDLSTQLPLRPRVVHLSGYLVASPNRLAQLGLHRERTPTSREWKKLYRKLGAYEASKIEGDFAVRAVARSSAIDLTIINPAAILGHSETGEIAQATGFAELVDQLQRGTLAAIPGKPEDWVPHVPVDYLAKFLAAVPPRDHGSFAEYTIMSPETPRFADLIRHIANHLGVSAPKRTIPVSIAKVLLNMGLGRLTGTSAEPLSFLVSYGFDHASADEAATQVGLARPSVLSAISRTADYLKSRAAK